MKHYYTTIIGAGLLCTNILLAQKTYTNMSNTITLEKFSKDTVLKGDQRKIYFKVQNPQNYQNIVLHQSGKAPVAPVNDEYHFKEIASAAMFDEKGLTKVMKEYQVKFTYRSIESHFNFIDTYYIMQREVLFKPSYRMENALYQNADNDLWISIPSLKNKFLLAIEDLDTDHQTFVKSDSSKAAEQKPTFKHFKINTKLQHIQISVFTQDTFLLDKREYYLIDLPKSDFVLGINGLETTKTEFTTAELSGLEILVTNQLSTKQYKTVVNLRIERSNKLLLERNDMMDGKLQLLKGDARMLKAGDVVKLSIVNMQAWPITPQAIEDEEAMGPQKGIYSFAVDKELMIKIK